MYTHHWTALVEEVRTEAREQDPLKLIVNIAYKMSGIGHSAYKITDAVLYLGSLVKTCGFLGTTALGAAAGLVSGIFSLASGLIQTLSGLHSAFRGYSELADTMDAAIDAFSLGVLTMLSVSGRGTPAYRLLAPRLPKMV